MGQGYRKDRLESEIVKETSQILLYELRDPRKGFITVTRAKVSDDRRYAKIFISVMGTAREKKLTMGGLRHAQGFVQKELSRRIKMRAFPEIHVELDESLDKAMAIQKMIDDVAKERLARQSRPESQDETGEGGKAREAGAAPTGESGNGEEE